MDKNLSKFNVGFVTQENRSKETLDGIFRGTRNIVIPLFKYRGGYEDLIIPVSDGNLFIGRNAVGYLMPVIFHDKLFHVGCGGRLFKNIVRRFSHYNMEHSEYVTVRVHTEGTDDRIQCIRTLKLTDITVEDYKDRLEIRRRIAENKYGNYILAPIKELAYELEVKEITRYE